ncbi:uncharacterized protein METZ01_LOCUS299036 [marine metagenome]|uniref:Uncharacterized protein n=1 Tax=marine metagenome TaxID=408172 RepID=A0A382MFG9_9ZZZZ
MKHEQILQLKIHTSNYATVIFSHSLSYLIIFPKQTQDPELIVSNETDLNVILLFGYVSSGRFVG